MLEEYKPAILNDHYTQQNLGSRLRHALTLQPSPRYEEPPKKEKEDDDDLSDWD